MKQVISDLTVTILSTDLQRFELAKALLHAKTSILWKLTEYGSWTGMCRTHVKMGSTAITRYIRFMINVNDFKYSDKQMLSMFKAIGWSRTMFGIIDLTDKISVKDFIAKYKDIKLTGHGTQAHGDRAYTFSLPTEQADIFDTHLENYGMTHHPRGRRGVREAMITLVNRKLK